MVSVHLDFLLYVALLALFVWRGLCPWRCCGMWLEFLNYATLLYVLMHVLLIIEIVEMIMAAARDFKGHDSPEVDAPSVAWLRAAVLSAPAALIVILLLCWNQTREHIMKIRVRSAELQHDRAIQIIALPAVYGLMAMSSLFQLYTLAIQPESDEHDRQVSYSRYETCYFVADLYEAWALYQFGLLTLEVLGAALAKREGSSSGNQRELLLSYTAVSSIMWLGTAMFVVVCVFQAGWSVWQWNFMNAASNWESYEADLKQFTYAGLLASGAAIYNVHTVEHTYSDLIQGYSPFTKFVSVKLLVFFSFWQRGTLEAMRSMHILQLSGLQVKLLHSTLLVYECLASALVHRYAWQADEEWYTLGGIGGKAGAAGDEAEGERRPLMGIGWMA